MQRFRDAKFPQLVQAIDTFEECPLDQTLMTPALQRTLAPWLHVEMIQVPKDKHSDDLSPILLISWGRSIQYVVDHYTQSRGHCIIVIGEGEDGCTFSLSDREMLTRGYQAQHYSIPNFPCLHTRISIYRYMF